MGFSRLVRGCRQSLSNALAPHERLANPEGVIANDEGQMTLLDTGLANDADLYFINSRHKLRFPSTHENLFSSVPSP